MITFDVLTDEQCPIGFSVQRLLKTPSHQTSCELIFATNGTYIIIAEIDKKSPSWTPQLVMPLAGLHWCLTSIARQLLGNPRNGGLPDGRLSLESDLILEEVIKVTRLGAALPDGAPPGVDIANLSRRDDFSAPLPQGIALTDEQLFNEGVWDALCDIVDHWLQIHSSELLPDDIRNTRPRGLA